MDEMLPLACWSPMECSVMFRKNNPTQKRPTSCLHFCVKTILGAAQIGAWRGRASVGEAQARGTPTWRCPGGRAGAPCPSGQPCGYSHCGPLSASEGRSLALALVLSVPLGPRQDMKFFLLFSQPSAREIQDARDLKFLFYF